MGTESREFFKRREDGLHTGNATCAKTQEAAIRYAKKVKVDLGEWSVSPAWGRLGGKLDYTLFQSGGWFFT